MKKRITLLGFMTIMFVLSINLFALGSQEEEGMDAPAVAEEMGGLDSVAAQLGVSKEELVAALGDPNQGPPDFEEAAGILGVDSSRLEELMKSMEGPGSVEREPYTISLNGIDFTITYEVFTWAELPSDATNERMDIVEYTNEEGLTHYYELVYLPEGNLNWYQCAYLAQDAGGYLACPGSEGENSFLFDMINDTKYFWYFPEEGDHYGISIGPFLGGYQPEGSVEPAGGWSWLSGEAWEYSNWAVNLDDGVVDKDPRDNTQPNDSGDGQPIMGFGELNQPVPTWGDYMETIGTYGESRLPGRSYAFIIEYESDPR
ncbi:MAG: hypothetical protein PQJ59_11520 [Spirochaetales bacterium]|nr:hypothetical protein [Spirochaetales bacterium]